MTKELRRNLIFTSSENVCFLEFVKRAYKSKLFEHTPEGDFFDDAFRDSEFEDFRTWKSLLNYLNSVGAIPDALKAAKNCFSMWKQSHGSMNLNGEKIFGGKIKINRRDRTERNKTN